MKDRFFEFCRSLTVFIFKIVLQVTYLVLTRKKVRGLPTLSSEEKRLVRSFWRKYGVHFYTFDDYRWYKARGMEIDPKLIPETVFHSKIEPYFASLRMLDGFSDKNYFDIVLGQEVTPVSVCRCIDGQLKNREYRDITLTEAVDILKGEETEYVCKPAMDSSSGRGVEFVSSIDISDRLLLDMEKNYKGNYIIQKVVKQHPQLKRLNPTSLNTVRICSFLYKGDVHIISSLLRIGKKGSRIDNVGSGGICVEIKSDGSIGKSFVNYYGIEQNDLKLDIDVESFHIPGWSGAVELVRELHFRLAHFHIINWDVAISYNGDPVIVEYNLIDTGVLLHQLFKGPLFGEMTEEVLDECLLKKKQVE